MTAARLREVLATLERAADDMEALWEALEAEDFPRRSKRATLRVQVANAVELADRATATCEVLLRMEERYKERMAAAVAEP